MVAFKQGDHWARKDVSRLVQGVADLGDVGLCHVKAATPSAMTRATRPALSAYAEAASCMRQSGPAVAATALVTLVTALSMAQATAGADVADTVLMTFQTGWKMGQTASPKASGDL